MKPEHGVLFHAPFACKKEVRTSPHYRWDNHTRESDTFVIFQYSIKGSGNFRFRGEDHPVSPGHAFIAVPPEDSVYEYPEGGKEAWEFSWVNFYGDFGVRLWSELREAAGPVVQVSPEAHAAYVRLIQEICKKNRRDIYEISAMAYRLYLQMIRHTPKKFPKGKLEAAIDYLRRHYREPLRVKELAAQAHLSREHFTRLFTARFNKSPAAYLKDMRLEIAARLLLHTRLPAKEVAFRSGFASATKFGSSFKSLHKLTPEQFRRKNASS